MQPRQEMRPGTVEPALKHRLDGLQWQPWGRFLIGRNFSRPGSSCRAAFGIADQPRSRPLMGGFRNGSFDRNVAPSSPSLSDQASDV